MSRQALAYFKKKFIILYTEQFPVRKLVYSLNSVNFYCTLLHILNFSVFIV